MPVWGSTLACHVLPPVDSPEFTFGVWGASPEGFRGLPRWSTEGSLFVKKRSGFQGKAGRETGRSGSYASEGKRKSKPRRGGTRF